MFVSNNVDAYNDLWWHHFDGYHSCKYLPCFFVFFMVEQSWMNRHKHIWYNILPKVCFHWIKLTAFLYSFNRVLAFRNIIRYQEWFFSGKTIFGNRNRQCSRQIITHMKLKRKTSETIHVIWITMAVWWGKLYAMNIFFVYSLKTVVLLAPTMC